MLGGKGRGGKPLMLQQRGPKIGRPYLACFLLSGQVRSAQSTNPVIPRPIRHLHNARNGIIWKARHVRTHPGNGRNVALLQDRRRRRWSSRGRARLSLTEASTSAASAHAQDPYKVLISPTNGSTAYFVMLYPLRKSSHAKNVANDPDDDLGTSADPFSP